MNDTNSCIKTKKNKKSNKPKMNEAYKNKLEKYIRERWPEEEGETLDIRWMENWEDRYRLNFWKTKDAKCSITDNYISRSIFVRIEKTPDGLVEKKYV